MGYAILKKPRSHAVESRTVRMAKMQKGTIVKSAGRPKHVAKMQNKVIPMLSGTATHG